MPLWLLLTVCRPNSVSTCPTTPRGMPTNCLSLSSRREEAEIGSLPNKGMGRRHVLQVCSPAHRLLSCVDRFCAPHRPAQSCACTLSRRQLAAVMEARGDAQLAAALLRHTVTELRKAQMIALCREWRYRSHIWRPRGTRLRPAAGALDQRGGGPATLGSSLAMTAAAPGQHGLALARDPPRLLPAHRSERINDIDAATIQPHFLPVDFTGSCPTILPNFSHHRCPVRSAP